MEQKPLVNVIIPTYDAQRFGMLKEAVQSVEDQTYGKDNICIIISINGPDLAHKKAVETTYADVKNITCIYTPRSNGPAALNNAIRQVTDGYLLILDDDDYLTNGYIEELCSHVDSDVDVVFGRKSVQQDDGTIDCDLYINKVLARVGPGKRKITAKERVLCGVHVGYLFNAQTVKNKFEPFDATLDAIFDTVYMVTNFGYLDRFIYALPAKGKETYVIQLTPNSRCRPSKEQEFNYWIILRTRILEKLSGVAFRAKNQEHLRVAIEYSFAVAGYIYDYFYNLPVEEKARALEYINACQSPFLDKAKFANQLNVVSMQNDCARLQEECKRLQQAIIALQNNRSFKLGRTLTFLPRQIRDTARYLRNVLKKELKNHAAAARRKKGKFNILYYSPVQSYPPLGGNYAVVAHCGNKFREMGHTVHFALMRQSSLPDEVTEAMKGQWDTYDMLKNGVSMCADVTSSNVPFDGWYAEGMGEEIAVLCEKYDIDILYCTYVFQSKILEYVPDRILKVIDTHDKMSNRYDTLRKAGQPIEFFSCTPEDETRYLQRADVIIAKRDAEREYFKNISHNDAVITISDIQKEKFIHKNYTQLRKIGFVSGGNGNNLAMCLHFIQAVVDTLQGQPCPFVFEIAGGLKKRYERIDEKSKKLFDLPWVKLLGFIPDLGEFYKNQDAMIIPVQRGTGINIKTVDALSYGVPMISTRCGSKGIGTTEKYHLLPNDDLHEMVRTLLLLTKHPEELNRLAKVNEELFSVFHEKNEQAVRELFKQPKLRSN